MNILLIGSGGREHALAWKIQQSPLLKKLYTLPIHDAMTPWAHSVAISLSDHQAILQFIQEKQIDLVVIGPELPLVDGFVDLCHQHNIAAFGPCQKAAQLEGSKGFTRDFCQEFSIPGARYARLKDLQSARDYVQNQAFPLVIKMDGLAAGKGVVIAQNYQEADAAITQFFTQNPQTELVIEEYLEGEEASFFCICDGTTAIPFGHAQDHKRLHDGDEGPNTGGMGTYAPTPLISPALTEQIMQEIILPTMAGMKEKNMPFRGILYAGLMLTASGPRLIEYNVRFGDPECQVLMRNLQDDLVPWLIAATQEKLHCLPAPQWRDQSAICVVMVAEGYPDNPRKGDVIHGLKQASCDEDIIIFHAATQKNAQGDFLTKGGRVLNITAIGATLEEAQKKAYHAVEQIHWDGAFWRKDIGWRAIASYKKS